ncbi:MAG TPA: gliding-motility protein MglA [candidate division WOR-3 bacterium]|uniref:Gliding-motility protein MglA n=1 Tax=candidate division WOR-3 bacterium TaxID=2052148 RepID=A0A7C5DBE0_UNCW3|nr:gliding-motility protein MglA [candidate division WOR-3 bacterium]
MSLIKYASKEITCKIVYYGPGRAGKTTNLKFLFTKIPVDKKSDLVSLATESDRTLFFDFLPIELGNFRGFRTRFQLYTVPGQVYYDSTRRLVLQGADGIVFVADSSDSRFEDNIVSMENMIENMEKNGLSVDEVPIVIQYNKRDLPDVVSVSQLEKSLNPNGFKYFESIAIKGEGVASTFKEIGMQVLKSIKMKLGLE